VTDTITLDRIDLSDPELYATGDPHAVWTYLREHAPVFFQKHGYGPGFWAITRYDDVVRLSSDRRLSSSGGRTTTGTPAAPDSAVADILVCTDPPRHTQLKALVNKAFTPRVVASLELYVRSVVNRLVDDISSRGECDFAREVAARVPFTVICELLGVPEEDRDALSHAVGSFMESRAHILDGSTRSEIELGRYFLDLTNTRRSVPDMDLISRLVGAEIDLDAPPGAPPKRERLSDADILALAMLLFIAGSETTMNSISGGLLAFLEHPDQLERLQADQALWTKTVEEVLRWVSPVLNGMVRTALDDIEVGDVGIRAGDKVTLWYPSANRDNGHFTDPFAFDIGRDPNNHVAFGAGIHFCLGASLARLEIRITLQTVLERLRDIRPAGEMVRLRSNVSHAIDHLPIRFAA
jgi:cholest-4-en-3-one 26-monooxygenase